MHTMKSGKTCGLPDGHNGQCYSAEAMERRRECSREAKRQRRSTLEGREAIRDAKRRHNLKTGNAGDRRYRARLAGLMQEEISKAELCKRQGQQCYICGCDLRGITVHVEHVIPVAAGLPRIFRRLAASCGPCNLSKRAKPLALYLLERQRRGLPLRPEYVRCIASCPLFETVC